MSQQVGAIWVDLAANSAGFQRDMNAATSALNSAQARTNAILARMEKGFKEVSTATERSTVRIASLAAKAALAVVGFQSFTAGLRTTLSNMRNMEKQAADLGLAIDHNMAEQSRLAAQEIDRLGFSLKRLFSESMTNWLMLLPNVSDGVQRAMQQSAMSTDDLSRHFELLKSNISDLETQIKAFEQRRAGTRNPVSASESAARDTLAALKKQASEIEGLLRTRLDPEKNSPLGTDEQFQEWLRNNTMLRDSVFEVAHALEFQLAQVGRSARDQAIWNELARAGVDLTSQAGRDLAVLAGALYDFAEAEKEADERMAAFNDRLKEQLAEWDKLAKTPLASDPEHEAWAAMDDKAFDRLRDSIEESSRAMDAYKQATAGWKGEMVSGLNQAILRFSSLKDVARAFIGTLLEAGLTKMVTGPIVDSMLGGFAGGLATAFGGPRASGGPVTAGVAYDVGERGPERFVPNVSGYMMAADKLGGGRGGSPIYIDARGATRDAIAGIRSALAQVNRSIEPRAIAANAQRAARGGGRR